MKRKVFVCGICVILVAVIGFGAASLAGMLKKAEDYSWKDYQKMSLEEQDEFFQRFESVEAFEAWMEAAEREANKTPNLKWKKIGKKPDQYTWEEYQALSAEDRDAFYWWFDSAEDFDAWMEAAKPDDAETIAVWDKDGKQPDAYMWEEYQALTPEEQESFYQWFASVDDFEKWMMSANPNDGAETFSQWDEGEKQPDAYTWEEYQALSVEEQDAFFEWFGSVEAYEAWVEANKPNTTEAVTWNKPGKLPKEYTWEEYRSLSNEEQDAFFWWFETVEAFEQWMAEAKNEGVIPAVDWVERGKLPNQYTWEEYQSLTPEEQEAFYQWFDSLEDFEAWTKEAMGA